MDTLSPPVIADSSSKTPADLVTIVQALSLARTLDAIVDIVRKSARAMAQSDGTTFILRDGDKCHYVDEDAISPLWKGQRFPTTSCISGWAMINRRAVVIPDVYADDRIPFAAYRPTFVKSLVMVPIRAEEPIGAIGLYWGQSHTANQEEVEALMALANTVSVAMENVQLYQELEKRVVERTRQLEDANRELESFSFSVSHDLQAPLRHINAYTEMLRQSHAGSLDDKGKDFLGRIQNSAARMGELIDCLLRLSRFGRQELQQGQTDLSRMAREVAQSLKDGEPGRTAEFQIDPDIETTADPALLRVVLENLLGNAWKFTSKAEKAVIHFGTAAQPEGRAYFVKDNGAGFDMQYAGKLFAPFQRLHNERDFKGTGIGLATVERIIHRHGGRVWAESRPEEGSTFSFTLGGVQA